MAILASPQAAVAQDNPFGQCKSGVPIRALARDPHPIDGRPGAIRWTFIGSREAPVVIECDDLQLTAEQVVYDSDTRDIHATGEVLLDQPDLKIWADRAELNGETKYGTFYKARGTARVGDPAAENDQFGSNDPDVLFSGEKIAKTGPRAYTIEHGRFTTCVQPTSRWEMTQSTAILNLDKHVFLRNMVLRVKNVPLFYLPALYYPINKEGRSTGFLMPSYSSSSILGTSISNAFFWVLGRSQDMTLYHDWYTKGAQGFSTEYRYVRALDASGRARFDMRDEKYGGGSTGVAPSTQRSYTITGNANQGLPHGVRVVGNINYFTEMSSQQLYQAVNDYSNQTRSFNGTVTGSRGRMYVSGTVDRSDYFDGLEAGRRTGRLPSVNVRVGDKAIGKSRVYLGGSAESAYLVSQENVADPSTDRSLWRFDGGPSLRATLSSLSFLNATASASWRVTQWMESLDLTDPDHERQVATPLTRQLLQTGVQVTGPTFSRIFQTPDSGYADRLKHVIAPTISLDRTSSFREFERVVQTDSVDTQVGGVTTINYGVRNQILARVRRKPAEPGAVAPPSVVREIASVTLSQSYYSDTSASLYDPNYQSASGAAAEGNFSSLRLDAKFTPVDSSTTTFRMDVHPRYRVIQSLYTQTSVQNERTRITASWYKQFVIPQMQTGGEASQFLNADVTLRTRRNGLGGTYTLNFDIEQRAFVNQRISGYYNSQCCGLNFDYQTRSTPLLQNRGVPTNHQFSVSFSLAGIGAFSNPLGSFGGR